MPTPIVHTAVAVAASRAAGRPLKSKETALLVVASNFPDLDLIPGILAGRPLRYHHLASHSFGFAAGMAALFSLIAWPDRKNLYPSRLNYFMAVCLSHPLMDLFTADKYFHVTSDQMGLQIAWPFSAKLFGPFYGFFEGAYFTSHLRDWFIADNFRVFGFETVIALLIYGLAYAATAARAVPAAAAENLPE